MTYLVHAAWDFLTTLMQEESAREAAREDARQLDLLRQFDAVDARFKQLNAGDFEPLDPKCMIFAVVEKSVFERTAGDLRSCVWMTKKALQRHLTDTVFPHAMVFKRFKEAFASLAEKGATGRVLVESTWDPCFYDMSLVTIAMPLETVAGRVAAFDRGKMRLIDPFNKTDDEYSVEVTSLDMSAK